MTRTLEELDRQLAERFGGYASCRRDDDTTTDTYGDGPAEEMDRLLDAYCKPDSRVLDIGCGAGFTLCRLAPKVAEIWGFEQEPDLLEATRLRATKLGLHNVHCVLGNVAEADDVSAGLPDATFDVAFSRRGPNVVPAMLSKLTPEAVVVQELVQGTLGVKPLFGREPFLPEVGHNPHRLIAQYAELDLVPVSVKDYFFDQFFRDADQLIRDLQAFLLWDWTMPDYPYDEARDRSALDTYVRYNTTPRGIRVTHRRSVYVFRRTEVARFPAVPEAKRKYAPYV
jgi:SAM-dependent methyltransferase